MNEVGKLLAIDSPKDCRA